MTTRPAYSQLLVSVRDAAEASIALAAGAALIDVKEPRRGSLGAADVEAIRGVVSAVNGRVPVSVALGELLDASEADAANLPPGVCFAKVGLAGCANVADWRTRLVGMLKALPEDVKPVAVIYADHQLAESPPSAEVLEVAATLDCAAVLVDTYDKSGGTLLRHWSVEQLTRSLVESRSAAPLAVVGGSLDIESAQVAAACGADYVAVRGAVCPGDRSSSIDGELVGLLVDILSASGRPSPDVEELPCPQK